MQIDSCWLPLKCESYLFHFYEYLFKLIAAVVHRCCSWVGLFDSIHWQLSQFIMETRLQEGTNQARTSPQH